MSPAEDTGRSSVTGLEKGVTGIMATPKALSQAQDWLTNRGLDFATWAAGAGTPDPELRQTVQDMFHGASRVSGNFANPDAPTQGQLDQSAQQHFGQYHDPQTTPGRYAESIGEMAPNALFPVGGDEKFAGQLLQRGGRVLLPGLGAQGAEDLAPDGYKPLARMAGGGVGGAFEGTLEAMSRAPSAAFGRVLPMMDQDTIDQVAALRQSASQRGINLTIPEAVAQVTGNTGPTNLQRTLENSARLRPQLSPYFAQRPDQVRGAVNGFVDQLSPGISESDPGMLGLRTQRAAQGVQMKAGSIRSQLAGAQYGMADGQDVDRSAMADLLSGITDQAAGDKTGLISPSLSRLADSLTGPDGQPITDIGNLSTARNYWREAIDLPPENSTALTKRTGGMIGGHLDALDRLLKANPNYAAGDQVYGDLSKGLVDPLTSGPTGAIGRTDDLLGQTGALFPSNPPLGQAGSTANALGALGSQDADLPSALLAQHLGSTYNRSARDLVAGPNEWAGAKYVRDLLGNDEQAATLKGAMGAVDPSGAKGDDFSDLVDALAATGKRQPVGSQTASYLENQGLLHRAPAAMRFFGSLTDPLEWGKNLSNWTGGMAYGRNLDALANMIRDPDTAAILARAQAARVGGGAIPLQLLAQGSNP